MRPQFDIQLIASTGIILLLGFLIHYSLAPENITLHIAYVSIGILAGFITSRIDYKSLSAFYWHIFAGVNLILLLTPILGYSARGSTRWIEIGSFRFQPSEPAKLLLILALSQILIRAKLRSIPHQLQTMIVAALPMLLVFLQPDLGSAIIIAFISAAMFFAAGMRLKHIAMYVVIFALISPWSWFVLKDYQKARITTFLNPASDPLGKGYNTIQSLIAVGSGQFSGRGLGHGTQSQLKFLPEYETDFIFAAFAEELGMIGSVFLLLAFNWMIWRLFSLARNVDSNYAYLVLVGIMAMFASQVVINVGMNIGLLPITGITLPLMSTGGTSLVVSLAAIGTALKLGQDQQSRTGIEIRGQDQ